MEYLLLSNRSLQLLLNIYIVLEIRAFSVPYGCVLGGYQKMICLQCTMYVNIS